MGALKKAKAAQKKNSKVDSRAEGQDFDLQGQFSAGVEAMHSGRVSEAAGIFARCFIHASKLLASPQQDQPLHSDTLQVVVYESLVYRGACLCGLGGRRDALLEARGNFARAVAWGEDNMDVPRLFKALDSLMSVEGKLHMYSAQRGTLEKLEAIKSALPFESQVSVLAHKVTFLHAVGQYSKLVEIMKESDEGSLLITSVPLGTEKDTWRARKALIASLIQLQRLEEARSHATTFLEEAERNQEVPGSNPAEDLAVISNNRSIVALTAALECMGLVCEEAGLAAEAAEYFARALTQGPTHHQRGVVLRLGDGRSLIQRARCFVQLGDLASAESQLEAVIQIAENTGDEHLGAEVLYVASSIHLQRGEKEEAEECLKKVAQVAAQSDSMLQLAAEISMLNLKIESLSPEQRSSQTKLVLDLASQVTSMNGTTCSACLKEIAPDSAELHVLPCRCILHQACLGDAVLNTGTCPNCKRHICGARYPGLPVCAACTNTTK